MIDVTRQDSAESREASCCDLLNSWARELGVEEATRQEGAREVADRIWSHMSVVLNKLHTKIEHLQDKNMRLRDHIRVFLKSPKGIPICACPSWWSKKCWYCLSRALLLETGHDSKTEAEKQA